MMLEQVFSPIVKMPSALQCLGSIPGSSSLPNRSQKAASEGWSICVPAIHMGDWDCFLAPNCGPAQLWLWPAFVEEASRRQFSFSFCFSNKQMSKQILLKNDAHFHELFEGPLYMRHLKQILNSRVTWIILQELLSQMIPLGIYKVSTIPEFVVHHHSHLLDTFFFSFSFNGLSNLKDKSYV